MCSQPKLLCRVLVGTSANLLGSSFGKFICDQSSDSFSAASDQHNIPLNIFVLSWPKEEDGTNKSSRDAHRKILNQPDILHDGR